MNIALAFNDGRLGIMQFDGEDTDEAIKAEIAKMADQPAGWQRVTPEEAAAIRAQRPKPEAPASVSSVSSASSTDILVIQQENDGLKQRMADLERQLAEFPLRLAEMISRDKAQDP